MGADRGSPLGSTDSKTYVYRFNTTRSPNKSPLADRQLSRPNTGLLETNGNGDVSSGSTTRFLTRNGKLTPETSPEEATIPLKSL